MERPIPVVQAVLSTDEALSDPSILTVDAIRIDLPEGSMPQARGGLSTGGQQSGNNADFPGE